MDVKDGELVLLAVLLWLARAHRSALALHIAARPAFEVHCILMG